MVVIRECDERGKEIRPLDPLERAKLQRDCLRYATRPNGVIDWEAYSSSYFGHLSMSDLSSESDSDDSHDSDCVFLYSTSGKEIVAYATPQMTCGKGISGSDVDTEVFGDDVCHTLILGLKTIPSNFFLLLFTSGTFSNSPIFYCAPNTYFTSCL